MNRRERRRLEKDLGITKHKQKMNLTQRLKSIRDGVEAGRERSIEARENRKRQENEEADKLASAEISSLSTTLMIRDGLSWHEATEAAKREVAEKHIHETEIS